MLKPSRKTARRTQNLEFAVDSLEKREMLAADVDIVGGGRSLRINGDNTSETVSIFTDSSGFILVDGVNTGLTEVKNLKIKMRGGDDLVGISGIRVTGKTVIKLGSAGSIGNGLSVGGQHSRLKIVGGRQADAVFLSAQAASAPRTINLKGGNDSLSIESSQGGSLPAPIPAFQVFADANFNSLIGLEVVGAGDADLIDAMETLAGNPSQVEITDALGKIATVRNIDLADVQAQFVHFKNLQAEAITIAQQNGVDPSEIPPPELNGFIHFDFMGSVEQLRYGKVVGDVLGLDAVFGALLNPTGGLVGPGNLSFNLGEHPVSYHGAVHDAAGYLFNYHNTGPGYDYLGNDPLGLAASDPLSGQIGGIDLWYEKFGQPDNLAQDFKDFLNIANPGIFDIASLQTIIDFFL